MIIHKDCRFFEGSKPCKQHKQEGVVCESCNYYEPVSYRILVIKLDSMGDVLRTTSLLPALKEKFPASALSWVTRRESADLITGNPLIDEILIFETNAVYHLLARTFDLVLGLDATKDSAALCSLSRGNEKLGFGLDPSGAIFPVNQAAQEWFYMGLNDELKKKNRKSYQQIMLEICNVPAAGFHLPQLYLAENEAAFGRVFLVQNGVDLTRPVIGLNTGSGSRWELKSLPLRALIKIIERLKANFQVVLLGGPQEQEKNDNLSRLTGALDTGCNNSLREFAGIVNQCSLVISGDTLALHIALALQKKIVAFFGPTSPHEIELSLLGEKYFAPLDCISCYHPSCQKTPNCMELIKVDDIISAAERLMT